MFKSTLQKAKQNAKSDVKEAENYAGQVLSDNEQDDDDINDTSWMTTALKFKKHIDVRHTITFSNRLLILLFCIVGSIQKRI